MNIGAYVESKIDNSIYSKKDIYLKYKGYQEAMEQKTYSYSQFINKLKNNTLTAEELVFLATIEDLNLNLMNVVGTLKSHIRRNQLKFESEEVKKAKSEMYDFLYAYAEDLLKRKVIECDYVEMQAFRDTDFMFYVIGWSDKEAPNSAFLLQFNFEVGLVQLISYVTDLESTLGEYEINPRDFLDHYHLDLIFETMRNIGKDYQTLFPDEYNEWAQIYECHKFIKTTEFSLYDTFFNIYGV